jgi:predicted RNA-binding Zn-ribbon protein involved in translation (DUF1610 family)
MSLVACRACGHQVDTSALACPQCGATDPARKISRQRRDARNFIIQALIWISLFAGTGWYVWHTLIPAVRQYITKPQVDQPPPARP